MRYQVVKCGFQWFPSELNHLNKSTKLYRKDD